MINKQSVCLLDRCVPNCHCKSNVKDCTKLNTYSCNKWGGKQHSDNGSCICIPRLDISVNRNYVFDIIKRLNWGEIISISCVVNRKNPTSPFVSIFIDIDWFKNVKVDTIRNIISQGNAIKVVHNNFNVWKIYEKKNNIHIHNN